MLSILIQWTSNYFTVELFLTTKQHVSGINKAKNPIYWILKKYLIGYNNSCKLSFIK